MDQVNPWIIALMFVVRCLVPLLFMLGLAYLLRRWGLIKEPPAPPSDFDQPRGKPENDNEGGLAHGKL
jgi:hypothetical protein